MSEIDKSLEQRIAALEHRVPIVERDVRDHAKSLSIITEKLIALEKENHARSIIEARNEERSIARTEQLERIEKDIAAFKGAVVKLVWIVAGGIATAFVTFVVKGGLTL